MHATSRGIWLPSCGSLQLLAAGTGKGVLLFFFCLVHQLSRQQRDKTLPL